MDARENVQRPSVLVALTRFFTFAFTLACSVWAPKPGSVTALPHPTVCLRQYVFLRYSFVWSDYSFGVEGGEVGCVVTHFLLGIDLHFYYGVSAA
jgi:hypothetical protein